MGKWVAAVLLLAVVPVLGAACGGGGSGQQQSVASTVHQAAQTLLATHNTNVGSVLVDSAGHPLYTFSKGVDCTGSCAQAWKPLVAKGSVAAKDKSGIDAGSLGTVKRSNGQTQVTYKGKALYLYAPDETSLTQEVASFGGSWKLVRTGANPLERQRTGTNGSCEPNCGY